MTPTAARRFGVGVLGTGIMGRRMLATLQSHPRFRVVALWDPDAQGLRDVQQSALAASPGVRAATGLDDLVSDAAVDLVYIASPPAMHRAGVQATLAAGRACLCEKPLAASVEDAQTIRDAVVAAGLPFAINFPFASAPASRRLIELVRSGALGEIRSASITLRFARWPRPWQVGASAWLASPAEGGFTREVLSHFVFLALRLFEFAVVADVALVRAQGRAETALRARLVHRDVEITIDGAVAGDVADRNRFEIVGSKGRAALVDWSHLEWQDGDEPSGAAWPGAPDRLALMLDGRTDHELASVDEALAVVRCIEKMLEH